MIAVRDAEMSEIAALARVWRSAWRDAHVGLVPDALVKLRTSADFQERMEDLVYAARVAGPAGKPVGFCVVQGDELHQLFVAASARGSGAAAALLRDGEARLAHAGVRDAWLACVIGNERAARFYGKHGWRKAGEMNSPSVTAAGVFDLAYWRFEKKVGR